MAAARATVPVVPVREVVEMVAGLPEVPVARA